MSGTLVIIPCGQGKVWDKDPARRPVAARYAYTGAPFSVNRAYAEAFADRWIILSAKYGFIGPDYHIADYDVTFKKKSTKPVSVSVLLEQARREGLDGFGRVIGLGGAEYRHVIEAVFIRLGIKAVFPFAGLRLGFGMQAIRRAVASGNPMGQRDM